MATNKYADVSLGTVEAVFNKLGGVEGIQNLLSGNVEVIKAYVVSTKEPFIFNGWKVEQHQETGNMKLTRFCDHLYLDGRRINFHLSERQKKEGVAAGTDLQDELKGLPVLNTNVLDFLIAHPDLIPENWKITAEGRIPFIFFWGTICSDSGGHLYAVGLYWGGHRWRRDYRLLDRSWDILSPAAVLASE